MHRRLSVPVGINTTDWCRGTVASVAAVHMCGLIICSGSWREKRKEERFIFRIQRGVKPLAEGRPWGGCQMCLSSNNKGVLLSACTSLVPVCVWDREGVIFQTKQPVRMRRRREKRDTVRSVMWSSCFTLASCYCPGRGWNPPIDSVPNYLDWMLDAHYSSHPNIIRD